VWDAANVRPASIFQMLYQYAADVRPFSIFQMLYQLPFFMEMCISFSLYRLSVASAAT